MVDQVTFTPNRALTANITASAGARARFYETGTTTPVVVYQDAAGSVVRSQPVEANASGVFPQVFYTASGAVKAVVTAADESALYTIDPVPLTPVASGAALAVSFTPITGVAATNVQAAIAEVQSNITANTLNAQSIVQTGGSAGVYTLVAAETITAYSAGQRFVLRANHANTGAATLNVDSLGAIAVEKYTGGSLGALAANDIILGDIVEVSFDGTRFILINGPEGRTRNYVATNRVPDAIFAGNYSSGVGTLPLTVTLRNALTGSIALGSNLITLQAGTYLVQCSAHVRAASTPGSIESASVALWDSTGAAGIRIVTAVRGNTLGLSAKGTTTVLVTPGAANDYSLHFARDSSNWSVSTPALATAHSGVTAYDCEVLIWKL